MLFIFNADDAGYTAGVNKGIEQSYRHGVVRSTTLMANMDAFDEALMMLRRNPGLSAGVHLNLTCGIPLCGKAELTNGQTMDRTSFCGASAETIREELTLQIEKVMRAGVIVSHLDSHHHVHSHPLIEPVALELAKRYRLPIRRIDHLSYLSPDRLLTAFIGEAATVETIKKALEQAQKDGIDSIEVMCHPGFCDDELKRQSSYADGRDHEVAVLCSRELKELLTGVTLGNYSMLNS